MSDPTGAGARLEAFAVSGVREVRPGDDLAALLADALEAAGTPLQHGDVLVVSSKVVSKAEGRLVAGDDRDAAVAEQTVRVVAERATALGTTRIVQSRSGPVLAAAGVDSSNVAPGSVLLLPADPDGSARRLRSRLAELTGVRVGVLVSDTAGRPWREGQVDLAIGASGVRVLDDLRGTTDVHGRALEVTVRAVADELASMADLVKGKVAGLPAAVVRRTRPLPPENDVVVEDEGPGAAALLRRPEQDWFRLGHVEAVRAALGVPPGTPGVPAPDAVPEAREVRLARALQVALAGALLGGDAGCSGGSPWTVSGDGDTVVLALREGDSSVAGPDAAPSGSQRPGDTDGPPAQALLQLGALAQRVVCAAWSEGLEVTGRVLAGPPPAVRIVVEDGAG